MKEPRSHFEVTRIDATERGELDEVATVAARAFHFDPFFVHLCPPHLIRSRGLAIFWRSQVAACAPFIEGYGARTPEGRLVGVSVWIRPDSYPLPVSAQIRQSAGAVRALAPRPRALIEGTKYLIALDKAHPHEPLWYLALLVADPALQRAGVGTALQQVVLEKADAEGLPAYLETQNPDNLAYYRRFGYELLQELRPVRGGPPLWTMRREPRSA